MLRYKQKQNLKLSKNFLDYLPKHIKMVEFRGLQKL